MTYYFYDLETSGLSPAKDRIMQFAGQRLDENLEPVEDLEQFLVKLNDDIIPQPEAILIHGVTPQETRLEGVTEPQFIKWLHKNVFLPDTILAGYGSMQFDDDFLRFLHYRNFHSWTDWPVNNWDIYRLIRLARDLRPEGINWPHQAGGPSLGLKVFAQANKIDHQKAHRADSDTAATIAVAQLLKERQSQLYSHLLEICQKGEDRQLAASGQPFIYSGFYQPDHGVSTLVASVVAEDPSFPNDLIVYDLRYNPKDYAQKSQLEISDLVRSKESPFRRLRLDRQPMICPISVLDTKGWQRLSLSQKTIKNHHQELIDSKLAQRLPKFFGSQSTAPQKVDQALPVIKPSEADQALMTKVRQATAQTIKDPDLKFQDPNLNQLLSLYKARNFTTNLTSDQLKDWENYKKRKFFSGRPSLLDHFGSQLQKLAQKNQSDPAKINLLLELQLYVQSILPLND